MIKKRLLRQSFFVGHGDRFLVPFTGLFVLFIRFYVHFVGKSG